MEKKPLIRETTRIETIEKPGSETYRTTYVQPII